MERKTKRKLWLGVGLLLAGLVVVAVWPKPDPLHDLSLIRGLTPSYHFFPSFDDWATETWVFMYDIPVSDLAPDFYESAADLGFSGPEINEAKYDSSHYGTAFLTKRTLGVLQWQIAIGDPRDQWFQDRVVLSEGAESCIVIYKARPDAWLVHLLDR